MHRTSFAGMHCSVARALEVVGEWWTLLILRDAFLGVCRFEELHRDLGIGRNVLVDRLQTLAAEGVLERHRYCERPERFEYRLTDKGRDLFPVIMALMRWGDRWLAPDGPPMRVTHRACGQEVSPVLVCPACQQTVVPEEMAMEAAFSVPMAGAKRQ